jgi:hypothetical protein
VTSRPRIRRGLRLVAVACLAAAAALTASIPGVRSPSPVLALSGGCSPASSTCYLFDVDLGRGPGIGTGFGTYRTMGEDGTYTGQINCHYGNETQTGVCGWGYEASTAGAQVDIFYLVAPDPGSKACDSVQCYSDDFTAHRVITGNYAEQEWHFELIQHFQIDVAVSGSGSGTVTSNPPGIDCPDDCDDLYAANYPVTLTAKAATGSVFAGWSGDYCTGTSNTCQITTDFLQSVTATFNKQATARPATAPPTKAPTAAPTEESTAEPTAEPTDVVASPTTEPTGPAEPTIASTAGPAPTGVPSLAGDSGAGNLPIIGVFVGLAVTLVSLAAGALYVARRRAPGG